MISSVNRINHTLLLQSEPGLKMDVKNLGVNFPKTWGPKTAYFWVVL